MNHEAINNVRRKINEVMKKDEQKIVVGWRPDMVDRKEGDVWEDVNGRSWTVKNGIRQSVTKLDSAKTPWFCPVCEKSMSHRFDMKFWRIRGKCMDCVIKDEMEIRKEGKWEEYEQSVMKANYIAELKDKIAQLQEYHDTVTAPEFIDADDTKILLVEKWNVNIDKIKEDLCKDIEILTKNLADAEADEIIHEQTI
jgi:hypothetical protein